MTLRVRRLHPALLLLVLGCVTARPLPERLESLEAEGATCERFSTFDVQARALLDELLAGAPGESLVPGSARINAARKACARHTLEGLLALREREGLDAVQTELDALARAWPVDRLDALLAETPGLDLTTLGPMVMEARERAKREAEASARSKRDERERTGLEPKGASFEGAECAGLTGCEAAHCLAELTRAGAEPAGLTASMRTAARRCLDDTRGRAPDERARRTSRLLADARAFPGLPEETEASLALETLRRSLWPEVETALAAGQTARAWTLAAPFVALDSARAATEGVRQKAVSAHLEAARACGARALCARLHRRVAASMGGPEEPPLSAQPGRWERGRWACRRPALELPEAPPAMTLRLDATCRKPAPQRGQPDELRTFELEKEMLGHALEGEVRATCAGKMTSASFKVLGFVDATEDRPVEDDGALAKEEVARVLPRLVADCQRFHAEAARGACDSLATSTPADVEQRFAEAAVVTGAWAPCFRDWFLRRHGVEPPPLHETR
ncbi:MAG: hypothetical protein AB1938_25295 [Myxococcota bacterium]